jgi:hypothetical protein
MLQKINSLNSALPGMCLIDLIYLVIGEIVIFIVFDKPLLYASGFFFGVLYAVFASLHLSGRIHKVVYGRASTTKTLVLGYLVRFLVMVALFAVLYFFHIGDLLAALVGMFAMKISAYMHPFVARFIDKVGKGG